METKTKTKTESKQEAEQLNIGISSCENETTPTEQNDISAIDDSFKEDVILLGNADDTQVEQCENNDGVTDDEDDEDNEFYFERKKKKRVKGLIILIVAVLVLGIGTTVGVTQYNKKKEEKAYNAMITEYSQNLSVAVSTMLSGAADAESCGNLIKKVWYNAIYEKRDKETDPYTTTDGRYFVDDFNDALANLFSSSVYKLKIDAITENKDKVNALMKELVNPPEEFSEIYDKLSDLYSAYLSLVKCATDPSGNLTSYSNTFNDADDEVINCYEKIKIYIDN